MDRKGSCPLTVNQVLQEYFVENRNRLLEVASFLDRLERSSGPSLPANEFRMAAFGKALATLASNEPDKIGQIQLLFSDPTTEPKQKLDAKSAAGAWNPSGGI